MPQAYNNQQKQLIQRFRDLTHEKDSVAARFLKSSGWKYEAAVDATIMKNQYTPDESQNVVDSTRKPHTEREGIAARNDESAVVVSTNGFIHENGLRVIQGLAMKSQDHSSKLQPPHIHSDLGYICGRESLHEVRGSEGSRWASLTKDVSGSFQQIEINNSISQQLSAQAGNIREVANVLAKDCTVSIHPVKVGDSRIGATYDLLESRDLPKGVSSTGSFGLVQPDHLSSNQQTASSCEPELTQAKLSHLLPHPPESWTDCYDDEVDAARLEMSENAKIENPKLKQRLLDIYLASALNYDFRDKARGQYVFLLRRPGLTDEHLSAILRRYGMRPGLALGHGMWDLISIEEAGLLARNPVNDIFQWARTNKVGTDEAIKTELESTVEDIQDGIHSWWEAPFIFKSLLGIENSPVEQVLIALKTYGIEPEYWLGLCSHEGHQKVQIKRQLDIIKTNDAILRDEPLPTGCDEGYVSLSYDLIKIIDNLRLRGGDEAETFASIKRCFGDSTMSDLHMFVCLAEYDIFPEQWAKIATEDVHRLGPLQNIDCDDAKGIHCSQAVKDTVWSYARRIENGFLDVASASEHFKKLLGNCAMSDAEMHKNLTLHGISSHQLLYPRSGTLGERLRAMYDSFRLGSLSRCEAAQLCRDLFEDPDFILNSLPDELIERGLQTKLVPPNLYSALEEDIPDFYQAVQMQMVTPLQGFECIVDTFDTWKLDRSEIAAYLQYLKIPTNWIAPYVAVYVQTDDESSNSKSPNMTTTVYEAQMKSLEDLETGSTFNMEVYSQLQDIYTSTVSNRIEAQEAISLVKVVLGFPDVTDEFLARCLNAYGISASQILHHRTEDGHMGTIKRLTLTQPRSPREEENNSQFSTVSNQPSSNCVIGCESASSTKPPVFPATEKSRRLTRSSDETPKLLRLKEGIHVLPNSFEREACYKSSSRADRSPCKRNASNPDPNDQSRKQQKRDGSPAPLLERIRIVEVVHDGWNACSSSDHERACGSLGVDPNRNHSVAESSHFDDEIDEAHTPESFDLLEDSSKETSDLELVKDLAAVNASTQYFPRGLGGTLRIDFPKDDPNRVRSGSEQAPEDVTCDFDSADIVQSIETYDYNDNRYFGNQQPVSSTPQPPAALQKLFNTYRDSPTENPDLIGIEGAMKYLQALEINLDEVSVLVISEALQSPTMGEFTREGYLTGWQRLALGYPGGAGSLANQSVLIGKLCSSLPNDDELFKRVYKHTFLIARNPGQKSILMDTAIEYWRLLFTYPSRTWNTTTTPWLDYYIEFLETKWKKGVNKDLWIMTLSFFFKSKEDENFGWWSEDGAWPSVLDEFVKFVKEKRGDGGHAENMEVE